MTEYKLVVVGGKYDITISLFYIRFGRTVSAVLGRISRLVGPLADHLLRRSSKWFDPKGDTFLTFDASTINRIINKVHIGCRNLL